MSPVLLPSEAPRLFVWVFFTLPVIPLLVTGVHVPWDILRATMLAFIEHLLLPGPRHTVPSLTPTVTLGEGGAILILPGGTEDSETGHTGDSTRW